MASECTSSFSAVINYGAGYTSCSNSTMQIRYQMFIEADGLPEMAVNFATKSSWNSGSVDYKVDYKPKQIVEFSSSVYAYGDEKDAFYIEEDDLYLIGSAEHAIGPLHMDYVFEEKELPRRYVGFSTSFRRESGSYGKDTRGILRVHQFDKLEMYSFCRPDKLVTGSSAKSGRTNLVDRAVGDRSRFENRKEVLSEAGMR